MIRISIKPPIIRDFARKIGAAFAEVRAEFAFMTRELAEEAVGIMRSLCPVGRTGNLRGSITILVRPNAWVVGPTVPYAKYVEYGVKPTGYIEGRLVGRGGRWINPDAERVGSAAGKRLVTFPPRRATKRGIVYLPYSWFGFHPGQRPRRFIRETARIIRRKLPDRLRGFARMVVVRVWSRLLR